MINIIIPNIPEDKILQNSFHKFFSELISYECINYLKYIIMNINYYKTINKKIQCNINILGYTFNNFQYFNLATHSDKKIYTFVLHVKNNENNIHFEFSFNSETNIFYFYIYNDESISYKTIYKLFFKDNKNKLKKIIYSCIYKYIYSTFLKLKV